MRILLSGASGFVGAFLSDFLSSKGHTLFRLVRRPPGGDREIFWDPFNGVVSKERLEGFDAWIHLSGEPLTLSRWSQSKKAKILSSRVTSTRFLAKAAASLGSPPRLFISVSAVGYYGDRSEELLSEKSSSGQGFLASVCREWEMAASAIADKGVRVVHPRFGQILGANSYAFAKMQRLYRWGLGATLGTGLQWMSWIAIEDVGRAMEHLFASNLEGPVNFVSPYPVRQREFSHTLASILHRRAIFRIPAWFLRFLFGELADGLLLNSCRAAPQKLLDSGFLFQVESLRDALLSSIDKTRAESL